MEIRKLALDWVYLPKPIWNHPSIVFITVFRIKLIAIPFILFVVEGQPQESLEATLVLSIIHGHLTGPNAIATTSSARGPRVVGRRNWGWRRRSGNGTILFILLLFGIHIGGHPGGWDPMGFLAFTLPQPLVTRLPFGVEVLVGIVLGKPAAAQIAKVGVAFEAYHVIASHSLLAARVASRAGRGMAL